MAVVQDHREGVAGHRTQRNPRRRTEQSELARSRSPSPEPVLLAPLRVQWVRRIGATHRMLRAQNRCFANPTSRDPEAGPEQ